MKKISEKDLEVFQTAVLRDYGIKLEGNALYQTAFNLLQFFEALIKFDQGSKNNRGSKVVQDNPLNTKDREYKIK